MLVLGYVWAQPMQVDEVTGAEEERLGVVAIGASAGFPAYRTGRVTASLQSGVVGFAAHASIGPTGAAGGADLRVYPPVPLPVPAYVAVGADLYTGRVAPHLVAGLHVPMAESWRLDVEAGAGWLPLLDEVRIAPIVSVGVSFAFTTGWSVVEGDPGTGASTSGSSRSGESCRPRSPDETLLDDALRAATRRFILDATAAYGTVYRNLAYELTEVRRTVEEGEATLFLSYDGSVVQRATGQRVEASGRAEVDFTWTGCAWRRGALRY